MKAHAIFLHFKKLGENFDHSYLRNFCPKRYNQYIHVPSQGHSGGLITIWNGNTMTGRLFSKSYFKITIEFTCNLNNFTLYHTNAYNPNSAEGKHEFSDWIMNLDTSHMSHWKIMGDFNFIKGHKYRNRPGGDHNNMMVFNNIIQSHDLVEISIKGRAYTWRNMQEYPQLEKLD